MIIRRAVLLALIASVGACAGDGCEGAAPAEGEFPESRRLNRPLRFRLTSQGADFLGDNAVAILRGVIGGDDTGAIVLDLAAYDMGDLTVAEMGDGGVSLRDVVIAVNVNPQQVRLELIDEPGRFRARIDAAQISLRPGGVLAFSGDGDDSIDVACQLDNGLDPEDPQRARIGTVTLELIIQPFVNENGRVDALVDVPELTIHDFGVLFPVNCGIEECTDGCVECRFGCPLLSGSAAMADALLADAKERIADLVRGQIRENIDSGLAALGAQPLDLEINTAALMGDLIPSAKSALPIRAMLAPSIGGININSDPGGLGMDILFEAGVDAQPHRCVSPIVADPEHRFGPPPVAERSTHPVHFVLAFAGGALDAAVWSAYKSGLLCVSLSSAEIAQISDGALALTAGGLESLLPGISSLASNDAPLQVTLEPGFTAEDFPLVRVQQRDGGQAQIIVGLTKVGMSLHAQIDGRFSRVIGLEATAEITAGLVALPDSTLEVTLDGVDVADLKVTYEEVLPGRDLSQLAGFISGAVAGGLLSDVSFPIAAPGALTELLGTALELDVRSIRADGDKGDWIAARLALEQTQQAVKAARTEVTGLPEAAAPGMAPEPSVPASDDRGEPLEYQVKVDHLPWTSFSKGRLPDLAGPHWLVHGEHSVRVRARYVDSPRSLDLRGWQGSVIVAPPTAEPGRPLQTTHAPSVGEAGCQQPGPAPLFLAPLFRRGGPALAWAGLVAGCEDGKEGAGTCATTADCPPRQACSRGACVPAPTCDAPSECCPGQVCLTGLCQDPAACDAEHCAGAREQCQGDWCVRLACADDSVCPAGLRCAQGRCAQGVPCDGRCEAGEACHAITAECRPAPAACGAQTCGDGALLHVVDPDGSLLGGGCGWDEAACGCVESPPLQAGDIGRWGSAGWLDGKAVAAAYDSTYADLVWLEWDGAGAPSKIESVAGVPLDQPRVAAEEGYRGGIAHPGPRTGRYASLVISDGTPLIAHRDDTTRSLAVAVGSSGGWSVHAVDSDGDPGHGIAAALLPDGMPVIAYAAKSAADSYALHFVRAATAAPAGTPDWGRPVALPVPAPPLTTEPSLDMSTSGDTTAIAWAADGRVGLAVSVAGASFRGSIVVEGEAKAGPDVAVAVAPDGSITVIYGDPGNGWLFASIDGQLQTLDDGARGGTIRRMGSWPAAAYNAAGDLVVAYQDPFANDLWVSLDTGTPKLLQSDGAVGFHNTLLLDGPGGASFVYTALLGFDSAGRSQAGPRLVALP